MAASNFVQSSWSPAQCATWLFFCLHFLKAIAFLTKKLGRKKKKSSDEESNVIQEIWIQKETRACLEIYAMVTQTKAILTEANISRFSSNQKL